MLVGNLCLLTHAMARQQGIYILVRLHACPGCSGTVCMPVAQCGGSLGGRSMLMTQDGSAHGGPGQILGVLKDAEAEMKAPAVFRLAISSLRLSKLTLLPCPPTKSDRGPGVA